VLLSGAHAELDFSAGQDRAKMAEMFERLKPGLKPIENSARWACFAKRTRSCGAEPAAC